MAKRSVYRKPPQENVACPNCHKFRLGDLDGIEAEAQERLSYSDKNIDTARTHLNLYIHGIDEKGHPIINSEKFPVPLKERVLSRIHELGITIRADRHPIMDDFVTQGKNTKESVVAEGIIFQISHKRMMEILEADGLLDERKKIRKDITISPASTCMQFFNDSYLYACSLWGNENIVGGYIHFDEYTPHLHLFVVPIVMKQRTHRGIPVTDGLGDPVLKPHLSAKDIFNKTTIRSLWKDFARAMAQYGVSAAQGLTPKGDYDKVASMDAVNDNLQVEISHHNSILLEQKRLIAENERVIKEQKKKIDEIKANAQNLCVPLDYIPELSYLVEIDHNNLVTKSTGVFGAQKTTLKDLDEIIRIVSKGQMKYDQKVIGVNAEIHQNEIAKVRAEANRNKSVINGIDQLLSRQPADEAKQLKQAIVKAKLEQFFPCAFGPERMIQSIPWFRHMCIERILEIEEPNTTVTYGMWEGVDIGRLIDKAFIDGSDSTDVYPVKVNLEKLTTDEKEQVHRFFYPIIHGIRPDVRERIILLVSRGAFSMKRFLHAHSDGIHKEDSYQLLKAARKESQGISH